MRLTVGFSTGAIALGDFDRALQLLETTQATAVELSALRLSEMPKLIAALPDRWFQLQQRFRYISFHAPTDFTDECAIIEQLESVAKIGCNIVVHPDTMRDVSLWRVLGKFLCVENMDSRKKTGRTVKELDGYFVSLPEAKLCFDIAHARQVDPTMTEGSHILAAYGDRLAQVHLSEVDGRGKHFAMSLSAKMAFVPFGERLSKTPIILESIVKEDMIDAEIFETNKMFDFTGTSRWPNQGREYLSPRNAFCATTF